MSATWPLSLGFISGLWIPRRVLGREDALDHGGASRPMNHRRKMIPSIHSRVSKDTGLKVPAKYEHAVSFQRLPQSFSHQCSCFQQNHHVRHNVGCRAPRSWKHIIKAQEHRQRASTLSPINRDSPAPCTSAGNPSTRPLGYSRAPTYFDLLRPLRTNSNLVRAPPTWCG